MNQPRKSIEYVLSVVLFTVLIIVCFLQVLFRFVIKLPLAWTEEMSRYIFILLVYVGASAAALDGKHVRVELIDSILPPKAAKGLSILVQILCALISLVITFNIKDLIVNSMRAHQQSAALRLPMAAMYIMVGAMFAVIALRFLQATWKTLRELREGGETA